VNLFDMAWLAGMVVSIAGMLILGSRAIHQVRVSRGTLRRIQARIEAMNDADPVLANGCERPGLRI
jgi:hypothetical protein